MAKRWQFLLFFQSLNSKGKNNMYPFPKPFTQPKIMAHTLSTPSNTTIFLLQTMLDHIKTVSWHSPHAGDIPSPILGIIPEICYSTHHETQYLFLLAIVHGTWDLSSQTRDRTCNPCIGCTESKLLDHQGRLSTLTEVALSSFSLFILLVRGSETSWLNNKATLQKVQDHSS